MKTPEGFEKADICKYLDSLGAYRFSPVQQGFGRQTVDIIACYLGRFIGVEVKREGKIPTPRQCHALNAINDAGGLAVWGTAEKVIAEIDAWRMPSDH